MITHTSTHTHAAYLTTNYTSWHQIFMNSYNKIHKIINALAIDQNTLLHGDPSTKNINKNQTLNTQHNIHTHSHRYTTNKIKIFKIHFNIVFISVLFKQVEVSPSTSAFRVISLLLKKSVFTINQSSTLWVECMRLLFDLEQSI